MDGEKRDKDIRKRGESRKIDEKERWNEKLEK